MRIGIMGGTFDPIHKGHLMLGDYAYKLFHLDQIWYMPNGTPPHKSNTTIGSNAEDRAKMVEEAITGKKHFRLERYEIDRTEVNYSYLTMEYFQSLYPEHDFFFIIGADSLFSIESWMKPERLFLTSTILAAYRNGKGTKEMLSQIHYLTRKYQCDIRLLNSPNWDVSSSEIREKCRKNESILEFVPESVWNYINEKQLYKEG